MRCMNSLIRPTFFLYNQNQKTFTSPFPSWDLQRVEPGDNQSETAICGSRYLPMSFFFSFFSALFPVFFSSFFSSCMFVGTWNLQIIQAEERIFRKKTWGWLGKTPQGIPAGRSFRSQVQMFVSPLVQPQQMERCWGLWLGHFKFDISPHFDPQISMQKLEHLQI